MWPMGHIRRREFVTYDGDDPDGYALAVNIARRHLTKGQR